MRAIFGQLHGGFHRVMQGQFFCAVEYGHFRVSSGFSERHRAMPAARHIASATNPKKNPAERGLFLADLHYLGIDANIDLVLLLLQKRLHRQPNSALFVDF